MIETAYVQTSRHLNSIAHRHVKAAMAELKKAIHHARESGHLPMLEYLHEQAEKVEAALHRQKCRDFKKEDQKSA